MSLQKSVILLLIPTIICLVSGCTPTCFGKLDRAPAPGASVLAQDPAVTCPVPDATPLSYPQACHADIRI